MPMKLVCPVCGKVHFRTPYESRLHPCCSSKCGQVFRSKNIRKRHDIKEMERLYKIELKSLREISRIMHLDARWISHLLKQRGVKMRKGSEAIRIQWRNNPRRRKKQSKRMSTGREHTEKYIKEMEKDRYWHRRWVQAIKKRDKLCKICGGSKNLEAHHIKNIVDFPELKLKLDNGMLLCKKCHSKLHARSTAR